MPAASNPAYSTRDWQYDNEVRECRVRARALLSLGNKNCGDPSDPETPGEDSISSPSVTKNNLNYSRNRINIGHKELSAISTAGKCNCQRVQL